MVTAEALGSTDRDARRTPSSHMIWLAPIAATTFVLHQLWNQSAGQRIDLHIYLDAVASWSRGASIYDFHDRLAGLGFTYPPLVGSA